MDDGTYYAMPIINTVIRNHCRPVTTAGAPPSVHGMVSNVWYDRSEERLVYNVGTAALHHVNLWCGCR
ncbi:alkaline phosphatase family protein [Vibrio chagasii]|nr:alkaline phosphatase family protein [Vibrio chagasii]